MNAEAPVLTDCIRHGRTAVGLVCVHLLDGSAWQWRQVVEWTGSDLRSAPVWICPGCDSVSCEDFAGDLRLICVGCINNFRERYDPGFNNALGASVTAGTEARHKPGGRHDSRNPRDDVRR
jgi:hypothetical protein